MGVNIAVNWALIFGNWGFPELGAQGAAVATVLVQVLSLRCWRPMPRCSRDCGRYRLFQRFWRTDPVAMRQVFRLGWPIGLTGMAEGGLFQASALMMGWIGTVQLAAHGIALEAAAVAFMMHVGLSSAATIRVAGFHGTGRGGRRCARRPGWRWCCLLRWRWW